MQIAILQVGDFNNNSTLLNIIRNVSMQPVICETNKELTGFDGYLLVGDFSTTNFRTDLLALNSLIESLKKENALGKPIFGIGAGAILLMESGLIPGLEKNNVGLGLTRDKTSYKGQVYISLTENYQLNAFSRKLKPKTIFNMLYNHAFGKVIIPDALISEIEANGLAVFKYCDKYGKVLDNYPNGIAAISNKTGNVLAIVPQFENITNIEAFLVSMRDFIANNYQQKVMPLYYHPRKNPIQTYTPKHYEIILDVSNNDPETISVNKALESLNFKFKLKKQVHWEVNCDSEETFNKLKASEILTADCKIAESKFSLQKTILIREKENIIGQEKLELSKKNLELKGVSSITFGLLWQFNAADNLVKEIINSFILYNPYAHDCYYYRS